jgi:hypothetical protein
VTIRQLNPSFALSGNFHRLLATALCLGLLAGCCHGPPASPDTHVLNPKDLLSTAEVVARINANNTRLPTLWAALNYSATIMVDGKPQSITSDDGTLLFMQPYYFRLKGDKEFIGTVFDLGTNDREFWCEVKPGVNTLYRGTFAQLKQMKPSDALKAIPIQPDLIRDVLGIGIIGPNLLTTPAPILRFDPVADSYIILFGSSATDHWVIQKQIWYDRASLRPRRVVVYAEEGRPVLDAELAHDLRVSVPNEPTENWPMIAADYRIFLPESGSHMEFSLKDVRLFKENSRGVQIPNRSKFEVPDVSETDTRTNVITSSRVE